MKQVIVILILFAGLSKLTGQEGDYFLNIKHYPFIKYDDNKITCPADSNYLEPFYQKLDSIVLMGKGKINIVHIGGSHIQADLYTHKTRQNLQSLQYDMDGGRGFVFPYKIARTNNPWNYKVFYTGEWSYCKNTKYKRTCELGLAGYSVTTTSNSASIEVILNPDSTSNYTYTGFRVFHPKTTYKLFAETEDSLYSGTYDSIGAFTTFQVPEDERLRLLIKKTDSVQSEFTLYGILFEKDSPGIVYHSIGVNGAKLESYLYCDLYAKQISELNPDLVIFSIGTNDGNTKYFNKVKYHSEYYNLIRRTLVSCPDTKIMITVPNDAYYYKRYVNRNTLDIQDVIQSLASEHNFAVWDFFHIMGGLNSSQKWYNYGIMKYDRVHFNLKGYLLKGDLFTTALLRGWEENLDTRSASYFISEPDTLGEQLSNIK